MRQITREAAYSSKIRRLDRIQSLDFVCCRCCPLSDKDVCANAMVPHGKEPERPSDARQ